MSCRVICRTRVTPPSRLPLPFLPIDRVSAAPFPIQTFPVVTPQPFPASTLAGASAYATAIAVGGPSAEEAARSAAAAAEQAVAAAGFQALTGEESWSAWIISVCVLAYTYKF